MQFITMKILSMLNSHLSDYPLVVTTVKALTLNLENFVTGLSFLGNDRGVVHFLWENPSLPEVASQIIAVLTTILVYFLFMSLVGSQKLSQRIVQVKKEEKGLRELFAFFIFTLVCTIYLNCKYTCDVGTIFFFIMFGGSLVLFLGYRFNSVYKENNRQWSGVKHFMPMRDLKLVGQKGKYTSMKLCAYWGVANFFLWNWFILGICTLLMGLDLVKFMLYMFSGYVLHLIMHVIQNRLDYMLRYTSSDSETNEVNFFMLTQGGPYIANGVFSLCGCLVVLFITVLPIMVPNHQQTPLLPNFGETARANFIEVKKEVPVCSACNLPNDTPPHYTLSQLWTKTANWLGLNKNPTRTVPVNAAEQAHLAGTFAQTQRTYLLNTPLNAHVVDMSSTNHQGRISAHWPAAVFQGDNVAGTQAVDQETNQFNVVPLVPVGQSVYFAPREGSATLAPNVTALASAQAVPLSANTVAQTHMASANQASVDMRAVQDRLFNSFHASYRQHLRAGLLGQALPVPSAPLPPVVPSAHFAPIDGSASLAPNATALASAQAVPLAPNATALASAQAVPLPARPTRSVFETLTMWRYYHNDRISSLSPVFHGYSAAEIQEGFAQFYDKKSLGKKTGMHPQEALPNKEVRYFTPYKNKNELENFWKRSRMDTVLPFTDSKQKFQNYFYSTVSNQRTPYNNDCDDLRYLTTLAQPAIDFKAKHQVFPTEGLGGTLTLIDLKLQKVERVLGHVELTLTHSLDNREAALRLKCAPFEFSAADIRSLQSEKFRLTELLEEGKAQRLTLSRAKPVYRLPIK